MRNADAITAMSAKIAARLTEITDIQIAPLTADDIDATSDVAPFLPYFEAVGPKDGAHRVDWTPERLEQLAELRNAVSHVNEYIWESEQDLATVKVPEPGTDSTHEILGEPQIAAAEWQARAEDWALQFIPAAYRPDKADGTPLATDEVDGAEYALHSAYAPAPDYYAARFAPSDFQPQGTGTAAQTERRLAGWAALRDQRDRLVRDALAAGVTKSRIQQITGISRSTIDRIPGI